MKDSRGGTRTRDPGIMRNGTPRQTPYFRGSALRDGPQSFAVSRSLWCKRWCNLSPAAHPRKKRGDCYASSPPGRNSRNTHPALLLLTL
jgi:hypothetical protein